MLGRDRVGVVPLYYGESDRLSGIASSMKTLWRVGIQPSRVLPGRIVEMSRAGLMIRVVKEVECPQPINLSLEEAVEALDLRLTKSIEVMSRGVIHSFLGFSGA